MDSEREHSEWFLDVEEDFEVLRISKAILSG